MTKTIVALYDHRSDAETAMRDLHAAGFESSAIDVLSHAEMTASGPGAGSPGAIDIAATETTTPSIGMVEGMARPGLASGYVAGGIGSGLGGSPTGTTTGTGTGASAGGILTRLTGWGVPDQDAQLYAEGVRRGGSLLRVRLDEEDVDRAMDVLERGNIVDVEERGAAYRESGWAGFDESAGYYDELKANEERMRYSPGRKPAGEGLTGAAAAMRDVNTEGLRTGSAEREEQIPLMEEQVDIGKRSVERGSVRVRSYVVETPVEEQVRLRDETVTVERRPGGLAESGTTVPADAFRERTIEVTETDEEAVVNKTAHVRETVVVRKDVEERAETVHDTVRRTEVEIDDTRGKATDRRSDLDR
ncbi:YsnF/AvaK domain-containing protein [Azospirillum sp. HJ39]|uniref:YsnF/AvaK domain-containing protein n=1 Tax=Azospirillum sp. HJ39 TaxID=3159496 RepID=UPI003558E199